MRIAPLAIDLDGTLITCKNRQITVLRAAMLACGAELAQIDGVWTAKREGLTTREALLAAGIPPDVAAAVSERWVAMIEDPQWLQLDACFPDTIDSLTTVRDAGVRVVLVTARRHKHWLAAQLRTLHLDVHLDCIVVVSPTDATAQKSKVLLQLSPRAYIGDTESDFVAARVAGVPYHAVSRGQRSPRFLAREGVSRAAATLTEVLPRVIA